MFDITVVDALKLADMAPGRSLVPPDGAVRLSGGAVGLRGRVVSVCPPAPEMEQVLLEIGFVEGAQVEILHQGPFGGDPIAVQVDSMRVALRRADAAGVLLIQAPEAALAEAACDGSPCRLSEPGTYWYAELRQDRAV